MIVKISFLREKQNILDQIYQIIKINILMEVNSDQKKQKILDEVQELHPNLMCGSKNKITFMCISKQCKAPSLHCIQQQCTFCQVHQENGCNSVQLRSLKSLVKKKSQNLKYLKSQMMKVETNMFKIIQNKRNQFLQRAKYGNLTQQQFLILQNIFGEENSSRKFKGCQISGLIQKLKSRTQLFCIDYQIDILKRQVNTIALQITSLEQNIINEIINPTKNYGKVDSRIMEQDPMGLGFILQQLKYPLELKLLYRASENAFSCLEFHRKCDSQANTLTIAKTKHNKVIAAFTTQTWLSLKDYYINDSKLQTFVLSVNLRQRYELIKPQKAIRCIKEYGPIFGENDFVIYQTSSLGVIYSEFPNNLNSLTKYKKGEQRIKEILGQGEKTFIDLAEWQVFQVIKK